MWSIKLKPEGSNDNYERNEGGMIIQLTNSRSFDSSPQEVSRVAFVRRNSNNPDVSYEHQVKLEVDKARASCELLNEMVSTTDGLV